MSDGSSAAAADHVRGKVIVVTGAGSGFGRLVSQMVAARGARIVAADIDGDAATATASSIAEAGGEAEAVTADVTRKPDMDAVAARAVDRFGAIDVLVNNAGIMPLAFFADHERAWEAWDRAIDINLTAAPISAAPGTPRRLTRSSASPARPARPTRTTVSCPRPLSVWSTASPRSTTG